MKGSEMTPLELANSKEHLVAEYTHVSTELCDLLHRKSAAWRKIREGTKSDAQADREWDGSEDGLKEMRLRMKVKVLMMQISARNSMLMVKENEAKNLW